MDQYTCDFCGADRSEYAPCRYCNALDGLVPEPCELIENVIVLTREQAIAVWNIIDNPGPPTPAQKRLAKLIKGDL